jgi:hypothetical protein
MTRWCFVLGLVTGCSFALSGPDSRRPRNQVPTCDTGKAAVVIDGVLATSAGVTTLAVGSNSGGAAIIPALIGAVFVGAAIHGNNVVNACREANAEYVASLDARPMPPDDHEPAPPAAPPVGLGMRVPAPAPAVMTAAAPAPPPAPVAAPTPAPPPPATSTEPWASFWKEVQ